MSAASVSLSSLRCADSGPASSLMLSSARPEWRPINGFSVGESRALRIVSPPALHRSPTSHWRAALRTKATSLAPSHATLVSRRGYGGRLFSEWQSIRVRRGLAYLRVGCELDHHALLTRGLGPVRQRALMSTVCASCSFWSVTRMTAFHILSGRSTPVPSISFDLVPRRCRSSHRSERAMHALFGICRIQRHVLI